MNFAVCFGDGRSVFTVSHSATEVQVGKALCSSDVSEEILKMSYQVPHLIILKQINLNDAFLNAESFFNGSHIFNNSIHKSGSKKKEKKKKENKGIYCNGILHLIKIKRKKRS